MKTSIHLSRSNGYRELGMYDESILELEEIEGEDRWHPSVVEARYKTYRDAKEWELAMTMARVLAEGMPDRLEWLKNQADAMTECGDPTGALQLLKDITHVHVDDDEAECLAFFIDNAFGCTKHRQMWCNDFPVVPVQIDLGQIYLVCRKLEDLLVKIAVCFVLEHLVRNDRQLIGWMQTIHTNDFPAIIGYTNDSNLSVKRLGLNHPGENDC